ncbi:hypothetical protein AB433_01685 [Croceicoccus naphthovorans]|uniref:Peptidase S8/S53 domain-containing protein n=1 Tax=Croceicoccus naphthovorans TaxID=1348774 RepID=A0A0G3XED4_9SPHN|nr:hypothetical protein AB433_01685 [Croceicoccus naphthovorans]
MIASPALADHHEEAEKIVVKTQDDLPRFTYKLDRKPSELLAADDATFLAFADRVGADIDGVLAKYEIADHATLRSLLDAKGKIAMMHGDDATVMDTIEQERALEEKPDAKLLNGIREEAMLMAAQTAGATSGEAYEAAYATHLAAAVAPMPWDVVGTNLKGLKRSGLIAGPGLYKGSAISELDPVYEKSGALSSSAANELIYLRYAATRWLPVADETAAVLAKQIAERDVQKPDIWAAREVTLSASDDLTPVHVTIWDSGIDLDLFPGRIYTDANPSDLTDPHGIAFDLVENPAHGDLMPLTDEQAARYPGMLEDMKGLSDLQLSIESAAADAVAARISKLTPEAYEDYFETLSLFGSYSHGTHVAGIAARGNPAIRLSYARITFDWRTIPEKPTEELVRKGAANSKSYIDWMKRNGTRIANLSWGGSPSGWESALEKHGIGKDAEERKAIARKYFEIARDSLYEAMKGAPDILFITSAGNSDSSANFDESLPASFDLPNVLTVGAVDQAGDETNFTSYGATTRVHANGFQVPSYVPGGEIVPFSGTSMSSPNVTNLAAKLLALNPELTTTDLIDLIIEGANKTEDGRRVLINPKKSVELMEAKEG